MPTTTLKGFTGLQRMEYPEQSVACYRVRIHRQGTLFMEYFPFKNYPDEPTALAAATKYWHEVREAFPRLTPKQNAQVERRKSQTGIIGVRRLTKTTKGHPYDYWLAAWTDSRGNQRSKTFSINKYGEQEAKKLDMKTRKEALSVSE